MWRFPTLSSEYDPFLDATEGWELQDKENGEHPVYTKEKMSTLLANIDKLVHKEKHLDLSSEEDCREMEGGIQAMGVRMLSTGKAARKANKSLGAGFHEVLDSQPTPSRSDSKRSRGLSLVIGTKTRPPIDACKPGRLSTGGTWVKWDDSL